MKIQRILAFAAAMALSFAAQAHDCSGGAAGGTDATGNQCSDESAYSSMAVSVPSGPSGAARFDTRHERTTTASAIKPVATNAANVTHAKKTSHHASKKYSHRTAKRPPATTG